MKIKVEKFLMKQGNRVGKAAIEFTKEDGILAGFHLVGFTICDDNEKGMFILFPAAITPKGKDGKEGTRPYFFLRPSEPNVLADLENAILDVYESMDGGGFNKPRMVGKPQEASPVSA